MSNTVKVCLGSTSDVIKQAINTVKHQPLKEVDLNLSKICNLYSLCRLVYGCWRS
jgi:hypothetical protein